jgi:hypothetical protein
MLNVCIDRVSSITSKYERSDNRHNVGMALPLYTLSLESHIQSHRPSFAGVINRTRRMKHGLSKGKDRPSQDSRYTMHANDAQHGETRIHEPKYGVDVWKRYGNRQGPRTRKNAREMYKQPTSLHLAGWIVIFVAMCGKNGFKSDSNKQGNQVSGLDDKTD